jgi:hypothetical protein
MAKKKKPTEIEQDESIHFRPGSWLGQQVARWATTWDLSRGAAAKRLTGLASIGLSADAHEDVAKLSQYLADDFENALQQIHIEIFARGQNQKNQVAMEERRELIQVLLHRFKLMCAPSEEVEEANRVRVTRGRIE